MTYNCPKCGLTVFDNSFHFCNPDIYPPTPIPVITHPKSFLDKAKEVIYGDRQKDYGSVSENFTRIAARWSAHLNRPISVEDVAIMMIDLKLSRLANSPTHEDSWTDIAGYVGCMDKYYEELRVKNSGAPAVTLDQKYPPATPSL